MTSKILTGFNPLGTLRSSHSCSNISLFFFLLCYYFLFFPFLSGTDSMGWTILTTHFTPKWSMTWTAKTRNGERDTTAIRCESHFWNSFEILRFWIIGISHFFTNSQSTANQITEDQLEYMLDRSASFLLFFFSPLQSWSFSLTFIFLTFLPFDRFEKAAEGEISNLPLSRSLSLSSSLLSLFLSFAYENRSIDFISECFLWHSAEKLFQSSKSLGVRQVMVLFLSCFPFEEFSFRPSESIWSLSFSDFLSRCSLCMTIGLIRETDWERVC